MRIRNEKLDIIRGIAAILVLAGHTLQIYEECADNSVFNIITSIQMPLFMLVSGYAIGYSKPIVNLRDLSTFIVKRSMSLLLPWLTCSLLVFGIISEFTFLNHIMYILYHMESAFWFLFSLWSISIIFSIAFFVSHKISSQEEKVGHILTIVIALIINVLLLLLGNKVGFTFLGIKYTTYYMVFFLIGWIWHWGESKYTQWPSWKVSQVVFLVALISYSILITRFTIVEMSDSAILWLALRLLISIAGCILIIYPVYIYSVPLKIKSVLLHFGKYSLEYYIVQYFWINLFVMPFSVTINTTEGLVNWFVYFILMVVLCFITIKVVSTTNLTRFLCFGKTNSRY